MPIQNKKCKLFKTHMDLYKLDLQGMCMQNYNLIPNLYTDYIIIILLIITQQIQSKNKKLLNWIKDIFMRVFNFMLLMKKQL